MGASVDVSVAEVTIHVEAAGPSVDVSVAEVTIHVEAAGPRGPQGPLGDPANIITAIAGATLGGHRMVMLDEADFARYPDQMELYECGRVVGMTLDAALTGASATIRLFGPISEPSWSWTPGQVIFVGANGVPTQSAPPTGVSLLVGFPISPTAMFLDIQPPVLQA